MLVHTPNNYYYRKILVRVQKCSDTICEKDSTFVLLIPKVTAKKVILFF